MAPQPGHTIDQTPEYVEFIAKLRDYHAKRGTNFEAEPKVGQTPVDLLKLFKVIVEHGGYDKISEEKLAWRNMVNALELYSNNEASAAYSLKLAYYKNLAAYEITTIYKKEPPPPEILEHLSAKGGGLLTRTLENFGGHRANMRPSGAFDTPMGGVGDPMATPTHQDHGSTGPDGTPLSGRASRGLREAPPQRVIFQPDTASTRQSRHASGQQQAGAGSNASHHGPAGQQHLPGTPQQGGPQQAFGMQPFPPNQNHHLPPHQQHQHASQQQQSNQRNASMVYNPPNSELFSSTVQSYEPRGPVPIVLKLAEAPANAPAKFLQQNRLQRLRASGVSLSRFAARPPVPPGNEGPNIYVRCLGALRSGLQAEEAFALSHLVKISYERGDKYKFESFPGLAEGLIEKALQVGSLFYHDVQWKVSYDQDVDENDVGELDGVNGTPDILERIAQLQPRDTIDCIQTEEFADQMVLITEAALTVRNMVTLPENAFFVADFAPCRDFLCIALSLPDRDAVVELKHCALDIAEQLTPFLVLGDDDPLYQTLLRQLDSPDRGIVLTALRAIGRISMNLAETNRLGSVPPAVLQRIMQWLLLNDDELMDACLDFLYQYTAVAANVDRLLRSVRTEELVKQLVGLLSHGAKRGVKELVLQPERKLPSSEEVLALPPDLLTRLVATDEPERCYMWLRCFFEEDPDSSITQIAIWQAYQSSFLQPVQQSGRTMLGAAEFIRNVTHVYHAAGAQIQKEQTPQGEVQKFIIKGIRPRRRPISPEGQEFFRCQWRMPSAAAAASATANPAPLASPSCGIFFDAADKLYEHILKDHVGEKPGADGKVANVKERDVRCLWAGCRKYPKGTKMPLVDFMKHIKTHAVQSEMDIRQDQKQQQQQQDASATSAPSGQSTENGSPADGNGSSSNGVQSSNPLKHQRQRSSVSNGDLMATGGGGGQANGAGATANGAANGANGTPNGSTSNAASGSATTPNKRQKRSYVVPAKTISVTYEETATMRDERNPNLLPQAAGIPLSAVLVLRNIARNASKAEVILDERGQVVMLEDGDEQQQRQHANGKYASTSTSTLAKRSNKPSQPGTPSSSSGLLQPSKTGGAASGARHSHSHSPADAAAAAAAQEAGGWNERLFRTMLPRLYEIMAENRALATYITSLFQLIGEEA